jgi:hypothetical protein
LTVASAKYTYNQLLTYFETRPDKLFVVITSPPMQRIPRPENARAFANWLVNDWLEENNYPLDNVMVFDFYNVLTHPENHHRYNNGQIEHSTRAEKDTLYYDSWGDDHPRAEGGQKATEEFVPMLNIAVNRWLATAPNEEVPRLAEQETEDQPEDEQSPAPQSIPVGFGVIDDFESGAHPESEYWIPYWDEAVSTSVSCNPSSGTAYQGRAALQIDFEVLPDSWASCELMYYSPHNWQGKGLQFYLKSSQAGLPYGLLFYYQLGEERATSLVEFETPAESVGAWTLTTIPWEEFEMQDSLVYPESGLGIAILFGAGDETNSGTIWIDDLSLYVDGPVPDAEVPAPAAEGGPQEDASQEEGGRGGLPFCGNIPLVIGLVAAAGFGLRRTWPWGDRP